MIEHQDDIYNPQSTTVIQDKDEEQHVDTKRILDGALKATEEEHKMSLREGFRKYPKAVWWSSWFSMTLVMQGFDHAFIFGFIAFPAFEKKYGVQNPSGTYQIPAELQAGITNGVAGGEIIGLILNGWFSEWFGYRKVMIGSLLFLICFVFLQFFAIDIYMYMGAEILLGVPWGVFQTLTTTYAAEICPNVLRPYLTMFVPGCWCIGYLIGTGVIRGFLNINGEWAYRIPFALQWIPPIPIIIAVYFAPESPWWLVRKRRTEEATKMVRRLRSKDTTEEEINDTLAMMQHTVNIERDMKEHASYWDLFRGVNLRRTEICFWTYTIQQLCAGLLSYIVYFLQEAGLSASVSFEFAMGEYAMGTVGVIIAWFLVPKWGRRMFLLTGIGFMATTTLIIGFLGIAGTNTHPVLANAVGVIVIQYFVFFATLAPVTYTIVSEVPSNHLRTKAVALGRVGYNAVTLIYGQLLPRMIQKTAWNWGAKCAFFYGSIMAVAFVWAFMRVPEVKNRTFAEIDILFKNKVKARRFSKTKIDLATETIVEE